MARIAFSKKKAVIAVSIALALLIVPGSNVIANDNDSDTGLFGGSAIEVSDYTSFHGASSLLAGDDIQMVSVEGDDLYPSVTVDQNGLYVVTWTNMPSFDEGNIGIAYASDPLDSEDWLIQILTLGGTETHFDTAHVIDTEIQDGYDALMGVYIDFTEQVTGYYLINDITGDYGDWEFYFWEGDGTDVDYACIDDSPFYNGPYYADYWGPFNFYVYHLNDMGFDIPHCPIFFRTDVRGGSGGVSFFDAQEYEKTAPARDPDLAPLSDRIHTAIENFSSNKIIWKKIVPAEEPDYEYTPYQSTVGDGSHPAIEATEDGHVLIVYELNDEVKIATSSDDGENFTIGTIGSGSSADICKIGNVFYVAYVEGGNLFVVSSDDFGATWSSPEQINDEDGTVVDEANSVDLHESGVIAWSDERGDDMDVYVDMFFEPELPHLEAEITGKKGTISNTGNADATNVAWSISFEGGLIILGGAEGTEDTLAQGNSVDVNGGFVLGFGKTIVTLEATCDEGASTSAEDEALVILFLVI